jgi:hypothetical protein
LRDPLELRPRGHLVGRVAEMESRRDALVLDSRPLDRRQEIDEPTRPFVCAVRQLEPVVPNVNQLGQADHMPCVGFRPPTDARNERVPRREPSQLRPRLRRHACVLGSRHDRREHAVDVEQDRRARRIGRERGERVHAAYDTAVRLVVIGLAAGFLSALFGVGGGIVIVPLLFVVASWQTRTAAATSLAAIGITAVSGVVNYAFHGDVDVKYAALVGLPAAVGAVGGGTLQQRLRTRTVELAFATLMVATAVWLFVK